MTQTTFRRLAWGALAFNFFAILWGALVRASGSGAGCGGSWPACDGALYPALHDGKQLIEYTHRILSGLCLVWGVVLARAAFVAFPAKSPVRRWALAALGILLFEAALGAGLVLLGFVTDSRAAGRPVAVSLHLVNTFVLLATFAMTAWSAGRVGETRVVNRKGLLLSAMGIVLLLALGVTGALTALGHTLYPGASEAIENGTPFLVQVRSFHPTLAIGAAAYLVFAVAALRTQATKGAKRLGTLFFILLVAQVLAGRVNQMFGSPIWAQLLHLALAEGVWLSFVLVAAEATRGGARRPSAAHEAVSIAA